MTEKRRFYDVFATTVVEQSRAQRLKAAVSGSATFRWSVRDTAINSAVTLEATGPVPLANPITSIAVKVHSLKKSLKRP